MDVDVRDTVKGEDWFVPYIEKAQSMEILRSGKIDASKGMNRGEVADAMWKLLER